MQFDKEKLEPAIEAAPCGFSILLKAYGLSDCFDEKELFHLIKTIWQEQGNFPLSSFFMTSRFDTRTGRLGH